MPTVTTLARFRADPIAFLRQMAVQGGPSAEFRIGRRALVLVSDPALIEEVLVTRQAAFRKGPGLMRTRPLLGDGLLTADGPRHRTQRRRLQPAFGGDRIAEYSGEMARRAAEAARAWRDGETRDIHRDMGRLTLELAGATLFAGRQAVDPATVMEGVAEALHALYQPLARCPYAGADAGHAITVLSTAADTLLAGRTPEAGGRDLLSLLTSPGLTPSEQRDEAMTFLLAGYESVANALTWTWYALSQHPEVRARFESEVDKAGPPVAELETLPYTRQVIAESLRLYPPAWMVSREAREEVALGGRRWPAGTVLIAAPCVTHVDPRYWDDPLRFDPERWSEAALIGASRPRFAYFPFGGGPRRCIGERFALTEMAVVMSAIGRRWRMDPPVGAKEPRWEPLVTLRPEGGLSMVLSARR